MDIRIIGSGSAGNAYTISDGRTRIMLDCGLPIAKLQAGTGHTISSLDACLITHSHQDHCKAHKDLARLGVDIYAEPDTLGEIKAQGHRYKAVWAMQQFSVGTFDVLPFQLVHDVTNLGWLIYSRETGEKLLYVTDTMYLPYRFQGITHWMIEANNDLEAMEENVAEGALSRGLKHRIQKSHMSIDTLLGVFEANDMSQAEQIYLLHLSDANSREAEFLDRVEKATGAQVIVC